MSCSVCHISCMRDDRYRGTSLPRPVRRLCRMAEREADRARPDLLRQQAVAALVSDADREISPDFRRRLRAHDAAPGLFSASELAAVARTGLEVEIARSIGLGQGIGPKDAIRDALCRRGEGYAREQKCQLVADRHPCATVASESVKTACNDGASVAATLILSGQPAPKANPRVQLSENLLAQHTSGAGP